MYKNFLRQSLPYYIAIGIDAIGFTIVGPVLVPLINQLVNNNGLNQHLLYGFILSVYSLSFMLGAPILGALSDFLGRRRVLIIASFGVFLGYVCYALSFQLNSLWFLIIGRVMTGFCAASQCIAQAAMVDLSHDKNRVKNIGTIAAAMTTGLVVGPLASLSLNTHNLNSLQMPFYAIMTVLGLNLIYLLFFLRESHSFKPAVSEINLIKHQSKQFLYQFKNPLLARLFFCFFLFELGWSLYYQSLAIELPINLKLQPQQLAIFFSFIGLSLTIALLILVRFCARFFKYNKVSRAILVLAAISLILQFFCQDLKYYYYFGACITAAVGLAYTGLVAQLSKHTSLQNQGLLMGTSDALLALAYTITGLFAGYLSFLWANSSLIGSAILFFLAFILYPSPITFKQLI